MFKQAITKSKFTGYYRLSLYILSVIAVFFIPAHVSADQTNINLNWICFTGIWNFEFLETTTYLFHSFEEDEYKGTEPFAIYFGGSKEIDTIYSISFNILAEPFEGERSFGVSLRSPSGRWDILFKGSDTVTFICDYYWENNTGIPHGNEREFNISVFEDPQKIHTVNFVFDKHEVKTHLNSIPCLTLQRPSKLGKIVQYGLSTMHGITYFGEIEFKDQNKTINALFDKSKLLHFHLIDNSSSGNFGFD